MTWQDVAALIAAGAAVVSAVAALVAAFRSSSAATAANDVKVMMNELRVTVAQGMTVNNVINFAQPPPTLAASAATDPPGTAELSEDGTIAAGTDVTPSVPKERG